MNFNTGFNYAQPSLVGSLVFPGRQSVLPASTVPEYAAQAYPLLNYSSSAHQMVSALGDDKLGRYLNVANFNPTSYSNNAYSYNPYSNNSYSNNTFSNNSSSNNSIINIILNFINAKSTDTATQDETTTADTPSTTTTNTINGLSLFNPLPISDLYGNQIPFNNAATQLGLFGNYYGTQSIVSRYVGDTMSTDKDAPGYTWKYTVPTVNTASTTSTTSTTTTTSTTSSATNTNNALSLFDPLPISDLYGNQIPYNNAVIQEGLFGNVHGVTSILSRYVGDLMPTDKNSPGYTWKYTVPGG
ncbi:MAG TPA: hypothetical protein DDW90_02735 [Cyanobacteria bacterium UBA9971]|nr:hypothetical protein [Cyanobacteria bacterium UBA9971]